MFVESIDRLVFFYSIGKSIDEISCKSILIELGTYIWRIPEFLSIDFVIE